MVPTVPSLLDLIPTRAATNAPAAGPPINAMRGMLKSVSRYQRSCLHRPNKFHL